MKFTSSVIAAASGSVGGLVFSRNRYGQYTRVRAVPVNPRTLQQGVVRGALATLVARWTSILTPAQRLTWETWATNTPQTDSLGNAITITGQNAFVMMNSPRIQTALAVIDVAPVVFANGVLSPPTLISATDAAEALSIGFTNTDVWAGAVGGRLLIYSGRPQNPSKLFFAGPYRLAGFIAGAVVPPTSPLTVTAAFAFAAGQRVHVRFRALNADGRISTSWRASSVAV